MKDRDKRTLWGIIAATLGVTATGLYFGLHRFLWRLWAVLSGIWTIFLVLLGSSPKMRTDQGTLLLEEPWYWIIMLGPPLLLLLVAGLLNWIVNGLRGDLDS